MVLPLATVAFEVPVGLMAAATAGDKAVAKGAVFVTGLVTLPVKAPKALAFMTGLPSLPIAYTGALAAGFAMDGAATGLGRTAGVGLTGRLTV